MVEVQRDDAPSDRVADVSGTPTAHPQGTVWPARSDQHLEEGLTTRIKQAAPQALIVAP